MDDYEEEMSVIKELLIVLDPDFRFAIDNKERPTALDKDREWLLSSGIQYKEEINWDEFFKCSNADHSIDKSESTNNR